VYSSNAIVKPMGYGMVEINCAPYSANIKCSIVDS
jgi:hypothetical protein